MNAIAVVDENWGIGRNGKLLVYLPSDLKYFKDKTLGKTVIMGRETFSGIGRPLKGRETIVLSRSQNYKPGCLVFRSLDELLECLKSKNSEDVFVAGGETVYRQLLPYCGRFFITKMQGRFEADRHFPNLDVGAEFSIVWSSGWMEENSIKYQFTEYKRVMK